MIGVKERIITGNAQDSFHAVTYRPNPDEIASKSVSRPRLLDILRRPPLTNSASVLVAPTGFGKTTLARQWVADTGAEVQVVYVHRPEGVSPGSIGNPSPFGVALANLLNALTFHAPEHSEAEMRELLDLVLHFSRETPSRFVLDDLDFVNYDRLTRYLGIFGQSLMQFRGEHGLLVARSVSTSMMSVMNSIGAIRVVLPQQFEFDVQETEAAYEAGIFGTASLEQVLDARENTGGWMTGMLAECGGHGGKTISQGAFDGLILNEIVQREFPEAQHILVASAILPRLTMPLWEDLFAESSLPSWQVGHILAQLPRKFESEDIVFPEVLTASLRRMASFITDPIQLRQLLVRSLEWYVRNDDLESARKLGIGQQLGAELLQLIKPTCRQLALQESWQELHALVRGVPTNIILQDPDYTFWMLHILAGEGLWSDMLALHDRISTVWQQSPQPLDRGRDLLTRGWAAHTVGQYRQALEYSVEAYDVLPHEAHQERMYAASIAAVSGSQIQLSPETSDWERRIAQEMAFLPENPRWWHNNIGPMAFERMVNLGRLSDAYDLAARQTAQIVASRPFLATRYLLLMALIDIERMRLDSAEILISRARENARSRGQEQFVHVVEAALYEARGDHDTATHMLTSGPLTSVSRLDFRFRQSLYSVRNALAYGDAATADVLLSTVPWPADPWPRRFGDPHPWLLQALISSLTGQHTEALRHAERTLEEARSRNHLYLQVASHSALAYIYHAMDKPDLRDQEVDRATTVSGNSGFQRAFYVRGKDVRQLASDAPLPPAKPLSSAPVRPYVQKPDAPRLTQRERELIGLVDAGFSNQQIADKLYISLSTVKNHLANIYEKLGAANRRQATRVARQRGLIKDE